MNRHSAVGGGDARHFLAILAERNDVGVGARKLDF